MEPKWSVFRNLKQEEELSKNKRLKESKVCAENYKQSGCLQKADGEGEGRAGIQRVIWPRTHSTRVLVSD